MIFCYLTLGPGTVKFSKDPRYGLLRGGYGAYDSEYRYSDVEIEWCSTEHQ